MSDTTTTAAKRGGIRDLGKMFGGGQSSVRQFGILGALVVIILFFQISTEGQLLLPGNVINIVLANSYVLILAIGMVMVIIAGHIDLSVGSVAAFVGVVVAISMSQWSFPWGRRSCSGWPSARRSVRGRGSGWPTSGCPRSS